MMKAELYKLRRSTMLIVYLTVNMMIPILIFLKDFISGNTLGGVSYTEWIQSTSVISRIVMFVMGAFYLTNSICTEYQNKSITNSLAVVPRKAAYLYSKISVYFLVNMISVIIEEILTILGCAVLYRDISLIEIMKYVIHYDTVTGIMSFLTSLFLLWIIILQRDSFYPSLLVSFICAIFLGSAVVMDYKVARIIPWSAVMIFSYSSIGSLNWVISGVSIVICALVGIFSGLILFYKQDL